jgi:hypothetical protein
MATGRSSARSTPLTVSMIRFAGRVDIAHARRNHYDRANVFAVYGASQNSAKPDGTK